MKKVIAILLTLALLPACSGLAEAAPELTGSYEDGKYVVRIPVEAGDEGWVADDMSQDDSVVALERAEIVDGVFTAVYAPVADGVISTVVKHMDGIACDQAHFFDLKVENGAIEAIGGGYTASPDEAELDAAIGGEWQVNDEIMAGLTLEKNPDKGWELQIAMAYPGVCVLQANAYYDCELDQLVYADGTLYASEITNSPEVVLGDVIATDCVGALGLFTDENGRLLLDWHTDLVGDAASVFYRSEYFDQDTALAEGADSDWYMAVLADEGILAEYPYHAFVDVNGDGVPALLISTTQDSFITGEDAGRVYVYADGEAKQAMEFGLGGGDIFYGSLDAHALTHFSRLSGEGHYEVYTLADGALTLTATADSYAPHHAPEADNAEQLYLMNGEAVTEAEFEAFTALYASEADAITYEAMD